MKCRWTVECSWAIVAANGMWYQVVSPPNIPWSRLSWEGKVHSAIVKEATPTAISRAIACTCGAPTSSAWPSFGARQRPSAAAPSPTAIVTTMIHPTRRMLSEPSSSSERISSATPQVASASRARAPENSGTIQRRNQ